MDNRATIFTLALQKRLLPLLSVALLCNILLASSLAFSAGLKPPPFSANYEWVFEVSTPEGSLMPDSLLYAEYSGSDGKGSTYIVSKSDGAAVLYTESAPQTAYLLYDDAATPAPDAEWSGSLETAQPILVRLAPIAEVAGTAFASDGKPAAGATVELRCAGGFARNATASEAGGFAFSRVPAAKCMLSSVQNGESSKGEFELTQGMLYVAELRLGKEIPVYIWLGLVAALAAGLWLAFGRKKPASPEEKKGRQSKMAKPAKPAASSPSKRQSDLLATLDPKEKRIVEYVMHYSPAAVKVAKLRRELLIPKTSLTRTLQALERKQFLSLEMMGARQYVKLHEFFSEK